MGHPTLAVYRILDGCVDIDVGVGIEGCGVSCHYKIVEAARAEEFLVESVESFVLSGI